MQIFVSNFDSNVLIKILLVFINNFLFAKYTIKLQIEKNHGQKWQKLSTFSNIFPYSLFQIENTTISRLATEKKNE